MEGKIKKPIVHLTLESLQTKQENTIREKDVKNEKTYQLQVTIDESSNKISAFGEQVNQLQIEGNNIQNLLQNEKNGSCKLSEHCKKLEEAMNCQKQQLEGLNSIEKSHENSTHVFIKKDDYKAIHQKIQTLQQQVATALEANQSISFVLRNEKNINMVFNETQNDLKIVSKDKDFLEAQICEYQSELKKTQEQISILTNELRQLQVQYEIKQQSCDEKDIQLEKMKEELSIKKSLELKIHKLEEENAELNKLLAHYNDNVEEVKEKQSLFNTVDNQLHVKLNIAECEAEKSPLQPKQLIETDAQLKTIEDKNHSVKMDINQTNDLNINSQDPNEQETCSLRKEVEHSKEKNENDRKICCIIL